MDDISNDLIYKTLVSLREDVKRLSDNIDRNNDRIASFQEHMGAQQQDIGVLYRRDEQTYSWKQSVDDQLALIRDKLGLSHPQH